MSFLDRHFKGLNKIAEWVGLPESEIWRISNNLEKLLGPGGSFYSSGGPVEG
jgi:hypothetical protein